MPSKGRRKKAVKHSVLALADLVERRPVLGRESKIKGRNVFEHLLGAAYTYECFRNDYCRREFCSISRVNPADSVGHWVHRCRHASRLPASQFSD
jgi:hypothetical protein